MRLFLDRNKTLLPRIDVIFLLTRIMTFASICWFGVYGDYRPEDVPIFYVVTGTYAVLILLLWAAIKGKFDLKLAYLGSVLYDAVFLPLFVLYTGGLESSFFLFFYLTVSVAAYVLTFPYAFAVTLILSSEYVGVIAAEITTQDLFGITVRVGIMWVCFLALSYVSEYMRKSERRLMKLFNTLNTRTAELEKSQAQLEMIYENTRIMASTLEPDNVIRELMRIMTNTLHYQTFCVILRHSDGEFYYRARSIDRQMSYHPQALQVVPDDLISKVASALEVLRVKDLSKRDNYTPLSKSTASAILVPITYHGKFQGMLIAESTEKEFFGSRDEQLLSVVARSAGLALENAELHKRTEELSIIDELTGAYNYRYFIQKFEEEKKRSVRYHLPLSIIMVDIDWFKKLNDGYGHEVGNIVLKELAGIIKQCVRDVDVFARYGGEEFVIILPQTPQEEAFNIGERIRKHVEGNVVDTGPSGSVKITVSVGVSSYPENGRSEEELISASDQALYQAKGSGKNLVCVK